jgi:hypothetical protein
VPAPPAGAPVDTLVWSGQGRLIADHGHAHLEVPGTGRFAVRDGAAVTVEPAAGGDPDSVANLLYGSVAALVLAQRGEFALHACTVEVGGTGLATGLAISGPSGAGKSTTALTLEARGHRLVTDDVSPLRLQPPRPEVMPFGRRRHVWPDTAAALGLDVTGSRPVDRRLSKLSLPAPPARPTALHAVVVLQVGPPGAAVTATDLDGLTAVPALLENAYRVRLLAPLWSADLFRWAADLAQRVTVHVVSRPPGRWTADEVTDAVLAVGTDRAAAVAAAGTSE